MVKEGQIREMWCLVRWKLLVIMCGKIWDYYWLEEGHTMDKNNEYVCTLYWQLRQTKTKTKNLSLN